MADLREGAQGLKDKLDRARAQPSEQMKVTRLHAPGADVRDLAKRLASFYESKKLESQVIESGPVSCVQARSSGWLKAIGMSTAITVVLRPEGEDLAVEIGRAKWGDKALAAGAGMVFLWPLLFTAGAGAYRETQLPKETVRYLSACLGGAEPREDAPPPEAPAALDVNSATADQLAALPGLDRAAASRIVAERDRHGGFREIGELARATRLPPHVVAKLAGRLTFGGAPRRFERSESGETAEPGGRRIDW